MIRVTNGTVAPEFEVNEMRSGDAVRGRLFFADGAPGPFGVFVRAAPNLLVQLDAEDGPVGRSGYGLRLSGTKVDLQVMVVNHEESTRVDPEVVDVDDEPDFALVKVCDECGAKDPPVRCRSHDGEYHADVCGGKVRMRLVREGGQGDVGA